ncbi:MAG: T9SS type A sorting domain-containing protein [Lewinellaceae bacterium]|nr:T9SS type A sorting domain-containing protein [Lewinellaceae bacterium]
MGRMEATAEVDGKKHKLGMLLPVESGINRRQIVRECGTSQNVDIVWVVDATGSMGDELEYLKSEVLDVIGRAKAVNPELNIRTASVFYRDKGDDYIVKSNALTADIAKTVEYIGQQSADGGGDYPEAVHSALEEAISKQPWSSEAVARICFLVLDASPHQDPEVLESIRQQIQLAAKKGIRIVPVSGSGIQKDTEFLLKFFGLATNGSYVFLTDHSGIGGSHIEPTTDEYKVEQLNDLLVRIITEYSTIEDCQGKTAIRFENPNQQQQNPSPQALYYPNPANSQFTLELPLDANKVTLYDAEGKAVRDLADLKAGVHTVQVHDLPPGFYTLRIWAEGRVQSGKVIVVREL